VKPIDIRNESFESLRAGIDGCREMVLKGWLAHGPGTTRSVAAESGIDILTFRPRSTELYQCGLIQCVGAADTHEGIYQARTAVEWEAWARTQRGDGVGKQLQLV
jgi:hypothetical protein